MRNKHFVIGTCFLAMIALLINLLAYAATLRALEAAMKNAETKLKTAKDRHKVAIGLLNEMIRKADKTFGGLESINDHMEYPGSDVGQTTRKFDQGEKLRTRLEAELAAIEQQREIADTLWADVLVAHLDYTATVASYNGAVSPEERLEVDDPVHPHVDSLYTCKGPCNITFETLLLATSAHQKTCSTSGSVSGCGVLYYDCPSEPDVGHAVLTCSNFKMNGRRSDVCGQQFRLCSNSSCDTREWNQPPEHSATVSEIEESTSDTNTENLEDTELPIDRQAGNICPRCGEAHN